MLYSIILCGKIQTVILIFYKCFRSGRLPGHDINDLTDIHRVHIVVRIPFFHDLRGEERFFCDACGSHFFAEKDEMAVVDIGDAVVEGRGKTGFFELVPVAAGMGTAVTERITVLLF